MTVSPTAASTAGVFRASDAIQIVKKKQQTVLRTAAVSGTEKQCERKERH